MAFRGITQHPFERGLVVEVAGVAFGASRVEEPRCRRSDVAIVFVPDSGADLSQVGAPVESHVVDHYHTGQYYEVCIGAALGKTRVEYREAGMAKAKPASSAVS